MLNICKLKINNIFCRKLPKINEYVLNFTSTVNEICQDDNDKKINITIFQNISEALLSTLCHNKDDRIPCKMFVYCSNTIVFKN